MRGQLNVPAEPRGHMIANMAFNSVFALLSLAGAIATVAAGPGPALVAAAVLYALVYGIFNAWSMLVEILR